MNFSGFSIFLHRGLNLNVSLKLLNKLKIFKTDLILRQKTLSSNQNEYDFDHIHIQAMILLQKNKTYEH